ncbi:XRE family transcriptional regulator [Actinomadura craniellae]|uniref:XRE family transcriptional regulator n=1 Tax=Actinomadura craniellae TaxID=2231787 RepID=A0A365H6Y2_9ACTN|nr:helix-turn-helix transcriptional regulator [Actinomadura craniellae]RAY14884.1 XRE family transcriptional regulator [Actinomadura craniellae]
MAVKKLTPELKAFGSEVARLREEVGLTRTELAELLNVTRSYVGQVEAGTTRCRREFAIRIDGALNSGSVLVDGWDDLLQSANYPRWFVDFPKAEGSATFLRAYENTLVYGLLQIEEYARALLMKDELISARMKRQAILARSDRPMVCVVMNESVLFRQVGSRETMRDQLEHLATVSSWDNVTLQIAPTAYYRGAHGAFTIATQSNGGEVIYLATAAGGTISNESDDVLHVAKAFATLQARALPVDASRDLIWKVVQERWT